MLRRLRRLLNLKAFAKDSRGVSAVEFALVAPILILMYLALAELSLGMMASRRTSHLAAMVGDLAAQSESLTTANINDLFAVGESILQPFSTGTALKIRLTSVTMDAQEDARVQWSVGKNQTAYAKNHILERITTDNIEKGQSLIVTEVTYDYSSPLGNFLPGLTRFDETFDHHPRNGVAVKKLD